jgi:lipoprotein NlpD
VNLTLKIVILISILFCVACTSTPSSGTKNIAHKSFLYKITKKRDPQSDNMLSKKHDKLDKKLEKNTAQTQNVNPPLISKPIITVKNVKQNSQWQWPVKLENIKMSPQKNGLDIFGQSESEIFAARQGEVVYSGSALRGYGNLIIIKHENNYISAYGHNDKILVKEGDKIKLGQKIATMGNSGTDQVKLHFEIRHNGKPIDPSTVIAPD